MQTSAADNYHDHNHDYDGRADNDDNCGAHNDNNSNNHDCSANDNDDARANNHNDPSANHDCCTDHYRGSYDNCCTYDHRGTNDNRCANNDSRTDDNRRADYDGGTNHHRSSNHRCLLLANVSVGHHRALPDDGHDHWSSIHEFCLHYGIWNEHYDWLRYNGARNYCRCNDWGFAVDHLGHHNV
jgi:hypothetical protein